MSQNVEQFKIEVGGARLSQTQERLLHRVLVESSLNLPSYAEVTYKDMKSVDDAKFEPGKPLKIYRIGKPNDDILLFDGEIVELEPHYNYPDVFCVIRAFDRLHRLQRKSFARDFLKMNDGDIAKKLAEDAGLKTGKIQATSPELEYVFQDNENNLIFLQRRASLLGFVVYAKGEDLHFELPKGEQTIDLPWGKSGLSSFRPCLSTLGQPTVVNVRGWSIENKAAVLAEKTKGSSQAQIGEAKDHVAMANAFGASPFLVSTTIREEKLAEKVAQGEMDKRSGQYIQAEGLSGGNPQIMAGVKVKVDNLGTRFSGTYLVTNATHVFNEKREYQTSFRVTAQHISSVLALIAPPEPALRTGFAIGIVENNQDEKNWGRVRVTFPSLSEKKVSNWARVVALGAGAKRGIQFIPEVDDEVLVGFEHGDVNSPYIIGGLWNGKDALPLAQDKAGANGKTNVRRIQSRTGHMIEFDDGTDDPHILIVDKNGNKIFIKSKDDSLLIEMKGDITVTSQKNISLEASANLELKAPNIKINGSAMVEIDGAAIKIG